MEGRLVTQLLVLGVSQERIIVLEAAGHEAAPCLDRVASFVDWRVHVAWMALTSQVQEIEGRCSGGSQTGNKRDERR
jgi:hypothetical protein